MYISEDLDLLLLVLKMSEFSQINNGNIASTVARQNQGGAVELSTTVPVEESFIDETEKLLLYKLDQVRKNNPGSHDEIDILARLSRFYIGSELMKKSMDCLGEALISAKKLYGYDHPVVAELLVESAFVAFKVESFDDALDFLAPAVSIYENAYGKVSDQVAFAFHKLGRVYEAVNQLDQAEKYYEKAETTYQNTFSEDDSDIIVVRNDLARVRAQGN